VDEDPDRLVFWRQGRSLPYGEGVAFWALAEMVKAQAGILETDSADVAEAKLHETVFDLVPDASEARWVEMQLRRLVGVSADEERGGDRREESFSAWRRFFEALAEQRPAVLVFEDLHWADENLLDFVDYLVDWATDSPLLVLGTARPELLERRPGWGGGKPNAATMSLSPLSEEDTALLISSLLEETVMPAEKQTVLLARAGGNPLYAEEYARMVSERGIAPTEDAPLPETVQGIVAARLDALSPEEKGLIQDAAVIGKVFWSGALAAMSELQRWTVEERLHALERKEFVRRDRRSSVATETEYAFRHVLVRDVAYGQVPRSSRSEKHRRAAEWIETLSSDREDRAEMLAHHYLRALEFARAAGQEAEAISDRAFIALREAGDRSYALSAFRAATDFYREALELIGDDRPEKGNLLLAYGQSLFWSDWTGADAEILEEASRRLLTSGQLAEAASAEVMLYLFHWYRGEREKAMPHFERGAELVESAPRSHAKADVLTDLARFAMLDDRDEQAIELGREALSMAEEFGLDNVRSRILNTLGVVRARLGDLGGLADIERSLEASAVGSPERLRGFINLGTMLDDLGELGRSRGLYEQGLREAERAGATGPIRWLRAELFVNEYLTGRWDEALAHADQFLAEAETLERHYMNAAAYWVRAPIRFARGDQSGALADAERGLALGREAQDPQVLFPGIAYRSQFLFESGRPVEAAALLDEVFERLRSNGTGAGAEWLVSLAFASAAAGRGDQVVPVLEAATNATPWVRGARAYLAGEFEEAAAIFAGIGAAPKEAFSRLRAAEALVAAGRRAEADTQLQQALGFYSSVGATRYIREAEALFAASA
jgi:tetratricopeptide (TPR) repeat protein